MVSERATADVAGVAGQMQKLRSPDFRSLLSCGTALGSHVPGLLDAIRTRLSDTAPLPQRDLQRGMQEVSGEYAERAL